jgi:2-polyprenyl-6-methoxyphenol hydroxylase-like FAD-dependent oxidoreductase
MRAVVIGASVAGLLAARSLSDFAESVSIVDRDLPPDSAVPRKGVPQGRHVHGLLAGGLDALTSFFPGLLDELTAEGARTADTAQDVLWFNNGAWRLRCKCGVTGCIQTRPMLEMHVRKRVVKLSNVRQFSGVSATGLQMDARKWRVTGVRVKSEAANEEILPADLIVDCSGRGSKMPAWLEIHGFEKPRVTTITVNVGYSTRFFHVPAQSKLGWDALLILGQPPKGTRLGVAFLVESGELQVTLGGEFRDYPPDDDAGFLKFAESLEHPALFQAIRNASPASPIATYRFPAHVWNHYDRLKKFPVNLLVLGDALCSFNPIYGQGMTVAALEAQVLHKCLAETKNNPGRLDGLPGRYFHGVAGIVQAAWATATGADLAFPQAEGQRPPGHGAINRYLGHVIALSCYDRKVLTTWNQVTNMQRPLSALFEPSIVARVIRRAVTGGPALNTECPRGE